VAACCSEPAHVVISKMQRIRTTSVLIILLAYILAQAGGGAGVVLCLGADGHVALKTADGVCGELFDASSEREAEPSNSEALTPNTENCGPCTDLPVSPPTSHHQPAPRKSASAQAKFLCLSTSASNGAVFAGISTCDVFQAPCVAVSPTLLSLRSAVILS